MSELWLVVSRRARPDRRAGFAEEDGEVPGAVTRAFPAAEVWARDCGDQGATVCGPEAWWSVGGCGAREMAGRLDVEPGTLFVATEFGA